MNPRRLPRFQAFTLIELLVVIAIIAILAALLFPAFQAAKDASLGAVSISNSKQLGTAFELYVDDNDGQYPQATDGSQGTGLAGGWMFYSMFSGTAAGTFDVTKGTLFFMLARKMFSRVHRMGTPRFRGIRLL